MTRLTPIQADHAARLTDEEIVAHYERKAALPAQRYRLPDGTEGAWANNWTTAAVEALRAALPKALPAERREWAERVALEWNEVMRRTAWPT